jgi:predicted permease
MSIYSSLLQSFAVIVGLILVCLLLRRRSVILEDQKPLFGRLVTDFALPALIFTGLTRQTPEMSELVAVAIFFGRAEGSSLTLGLRQFLTSPIFISVLLGLTFSFIKLPLNNPLLDIPFRILDVIGSSLVIFVALAIGLMLKPIPLKGLIHLIVAVAAIKLIAKPLIAFAIVIPSLGCLSSASP